MDTLETPGQELSRDTANFLFSRGPSGLAYTLDDLAAFVEHARRAGVPGDAPVWGKVRRWRRRRLVWLTAGKRVHRQHRGHGRPVIPAAPGDAR
jgi:hypothetical protein